MTWPAPRELPWETADQEPDDRPRSLLIGASGQIGRELWRALQPLGCVLCTRHSSAGASAEPTELELDLNQPTTISAVMDHVRPNLVVNAAGYTNVERAEEEPDLAMIVNAIAVGVLAEEALRLGAALVHYSTDYVFDGSDNVPWHESDIPHPLNAYGRSKLVGEDAIRSSGASHVIVRTSWVYSPTGRNFVLAMLDLASRQSMIRVVDDQFGAPTPAWLVADTTAQVLAQARGEFAQFLSRRGGTLHVTCRGATTWHGLAVELFRQARRRGAAVQLEEVEPISTAEYGSPVQRPANSRLDCRRLRERFGLVPPDWRTALALTLEEILRRRHEQLAVLPGGRHAGNAGGEPMNVQKLELDSLLLIEPTIHRDERGYFCETWHAERYREAGLATSFAQDNLSWSRRDTLRGLHFQLPHQGKLIFVLVGEIYDVAVDVRPSSTTLGRWIGVTLSGANLRQLYVPGGFAHGFCVTSDEALVAYKCTALYEPAAQHVIAWNDPDLAIHWPVRDPLLSPQDRQAPRLAEVLPDLTLGITARYLSGAYHDSVLP